MRIRGAVREQLSSREATTKLRDVAMRRRHVYCKFNHGQRVHVWRRHNNDRSSKSGNMGKDKWIGFGVVPLQDNEAVRVGIRRRIWKCNSDQLRVAPHEEVSGAQLQRQEVSQQHLCDMCKAARGHQ